MTTIPEGSETIVPTTGIPTTSTPVTPLSNIEHPFLSVEDAQLQDTIQPQDISRCLFSTHLDHSPEGFKRRQEMLVLKEPQLQKNRDFTNSYIGRDVGTKNLDQVRTQ